MDANGKDCVQIMYQGYDPDAELVLSGLKYKPICSIDSPMSNGLPTRLMIKSVLLFAVQQFPQFDRICFKDDSTFDCQIKDTDYSTQIHASIHNFVIYGKTWYERHFNAECYYPDTRTNMDISLQKLRESIDVEFDVFWKEVFHLSRPEWLMKMKSDLDTFYTMSKSQKKSWMHLFYHLFSREADAFVQKTYGSTISCNLYNEMKDWIKATFIKFDDDIHMYIMRDSIQSYPEVTHILFEEDRNPKHRQKINDKTSLFREALFANLNLDMNSNASNMNMNDFFYTGPLEGGKRLTRRKRPLYTSAFPTRLSCQMHGREKRRRQTRRRSRV